MIIGIDPHRLLHAACAIDEHETELARPEVPTNPCQVTDLLACATPFVCRLWAIESVGGLGCLLAQQLVAVATTSSMCRHFGRGHSRTQQQTYACQHATFTDPTRHARGPVQRPT